ncbi:MAG: TetR/AcrR family transcriptional regulator [Aquisalinus sp.]|nr:TetR/AcrR family transcriptional regulator [Aquisalinus sp.]
MQKRRHEKPARKQVRQARQARARNTVEAIITASTQILAGQGWAGLNTNAIARRAGVSVGSVYEYFRNKEAIVDVIIDRHLAQGEAYLRAAADLDAASVSLDDIITLLVASFVELHRHDPALHRALSEDVPLTISQRERIQALRQSTIDLLAMALTPHAAAPKLKATILVDTADALTHRWLIDDAGTPVPPEKMSQELGKMLQLYVRAAQV